MPRGSRGSPPPGRPHTSSCGSPCAGWRPTITNRPSSSASAIARLLSSGVLGSPVVPITTIGPAPMPVISTRGSGDGGKNVQRVRTGRVREEARGDTDEVCRLGVGLLDGRTFHLVHARDRLERLDQVAVRAVGAAPVVRIAELEQRRAVAARRVLEGPFEGRPVGGRSTSPAPQRSSATSRDTASPASALGNGDVIELCHQGVECTLRVAVVVECAVAVRAALRRGTCRGRPRTRSTGPCCARSGRRSDRSRRRTPPLGRSSGTASPTHHRVRCRS